MSKTNMAFSLLLDLDDTLLSTNIDSFIPAYFQALAKALTPYVDSKSMLEALTAGTRAMMASEDFSRFLKDVFDAEFYPRLNILRSDLVEVLEDFYDNQFPGLRELTSPRPDAKDFMNWAFAQGYRLAIATNPLFPRKATHHRLRWAGFEPQQFEIVTCFEDFHFTKAHPAYFAETLGRMGWPEGPVLMVGDDVERDILPAQRLGLPVFHFQSKPGAANGKQEVMHGDFAALRSVLETCDPVSFLPSMKTRDAVMGIISSTPAVLRGMTDAGGAEIWSRQSPGEEWTLTELICHLRDTEREVHHLQLDLFQMQREPFIPRPDSGVWASERDYLHEDGCQALQEFVAARRETIRRLKDSPQDDWSRKARHAIFGPTHFNEVVGFMADHDRLHIHQAWRLVNAGK
jgi:FMN phosphatase YigB (HAD superfamily)